MNKPSADHLYRITLKQPADRGDARIGSIVSVLEDIAVACGAMREENDHRGPWVLSWLFDHKPDAAALAARLNGIDPGLALEGESLTIEPVPAVDWLAYSYNGFQPFTIGPFFIYGSHYEDGVPERQTGLQIDAATAFGSGEHATTAGCLQAMNDLAEGGFGPCHVLDMGTGSGILAIAASKLWPTPVLAVDSDEGSVRVAKHHAALNGVAAQITALAGDGFAVPAVAENAPYELILANILAGPLKDMASALADTLASGGYAVLSGMLDEQADEVAACYKARKVNEIRRYRDRGWTSLVLRKA